MISGFIGLIFGKKSFKGIFHIYGLMGILCWLFPDFWYAFQKFAFEKRATLLKRMQYEICYERMKCLVKSHRNDASLCNWLIRLLIKYIQINIQLFHKNDSSFLLLATFPLLSFLTLLLLFLAVWA